MFLLHALLYTVKCIRTEIFIPIKGQCHLMKFVQGQSYLNDSKHTKVTIPNYLEASRVRETTVCINSKVRMIKMTFLLLCRKSLSEISTQEQYAVAIETWYPVFTTHALSKAKWLHVHV